MIISKALDDWNENQAPLKVSLKGFCKGYSSGFYGIGASKLSKLVLVSFPLRRTRRTHAIPPRTLFQVFEKGRRGCFAFWRSGLQKFRESRVVT